MKSYWEELKMCWEILHKPDWGRGLSVRVRSSRAQNPEFKPYYNPQKGGEKRNFRQIKCCCRYFENQKNLIFVWKNKENESVIISLLMVFKFSWNWFIKMMS
jgi:hypothetical protein